LTARLPPCEGEPERFLINPFGLLFEEITASSLVTVNLAGEILHPGAYPQYSINRAGYVDAQLQRHNAE
jgi:ribulose-5-phosphate 4-epimerase/fuculose-1-phosphate aldolase